MWDDNARLSFQPIPTPTLVDLGAVTTELASAPAPIEINAATGYFPAPLEVDTIEAGNCQNHSNAVESMTSNDNGSKVLISDARIM